MRKSCKIPIYQKTFKNVLASYKTHTTSLPSVGSSIAKTLQKLEIHDVFSLLLHLPRDYEDRSTLHPMRAAVVERSLLFEGVVTEVQENQRGRLRLIVTLNDNTGSIYLKFYKTYTKLTKTMQIGNRLRVFGEVKQARQSFGGAFELHHPEYQLVSANTPLPAKQLTPVYPTTKGLTQNKLRSIIKLAFKLLAEAPQPAEAPQLKETPQTAKHKHTNHDITQSLAQSFIHSFTLGNAPALTLLQALHILHQPPADTSVPQLLHSHPARTRIKLEELTAHQINLLQRKQQQQAHKAPRCAASSELASKLLHGLPFALTQAQQKVVAEILADISNSTPMLRLVQGDVGAGKTLVAALAACHALEAGWQVAVVAPTEILAEQHFQSFSAWFEPLGVQVAWLASKVPAKEKKLTLQHIADNDAQLVVGTHALFQENVHYAKLGLVIIDEQHRFGVAQRLAMRDKGKASMMGTPHQLVMTATPIPRTLAMSVYGDMDTSVIDELPPGRTPITTLTVSSKRREEVIDRIAQNCAEGKQAYWVCPLVEDSETLAAAAAESTYALLEDSLNIPVGLVHGKMKPAEKQAVMQRFYDNEIKLLVATTVIEVGVNVPNASLMVIENAERMGLSQLHQLRGRVGRGSEKSYCVLMYQMPLSDTGNARLSVLKNSNDGFYIAEQDLLLRGPGELVGKRQSGNIGFYVANLQTDQQLLPEAKRIAQHILATHPDYANDLAELWLGKRKDYQHV